jgi:hypothetical protein
VWFYTKTSDSIYQSKGTSMKARKVFTALMASKGYTDADLAMTGDKYNNPAMQGRWNYFLAGWEMRSVVA